MGLLQKENEWKESLANLFNIAHAGAMKLMTIKEDKDFFQLQHRQGYPRKMGSLDVALVKIGASKLKRQERPKKYI